MVARASSSDYRSTRRHSAHTPEQRHADYRDTPHHPTHLQSAVPTCTHTSSSGRHDPPNPPGHGLVHRLAPVDGTHFRSRPDLKPDEGFHAVGTRGRERTRHGCERPALHPRVGHVPGERRRHGAQHLRLQESRYPPRCDCLSRTPGRHPLLPGQSGEDDGHAPLPPRRGHGYEPAVRPARQQQDLVLTQLR